MNIPSGDELNTNMLMFVFIGIPAIVVVGAVVLLLAGIVYRPAWVLLKDLYSRLRGE